MVTITLKYRVVGATSTSLSGKTFRIGWNNGSTSGNASFSSSSWEEITAGTWVTKTTSYVNVSAPSGSITLTANPPSGYTFNGWSNPSGSWGSNTNPVSITGLTGDLTVECTVLGASYTITASAGSHGSISPSGSLTYYTGESVVFQATPDSGYGVSDWIVDGSSTGNTSSTYTFTNLSASHTISVVFAEARYSVRIYRSGWPYVGTYGDHSSSATYIDVSGAAGETYDVCWSQWSGSDTKNICDYGSNTQYGGEDFDRITFGTTSSPVYPGKRYSALTKTITATAGSGGSISPSGAVQVNYGASKTFTVSADSGYRIKQILVDGSPITL